MDAKIESRLYENDGRTPNNPRLPLVIMRGTESAAADDCAAWLEEKFIAHGWSGVWRWGVYPYHHFHTNNHEVLGVSRGNARLMFGGENGDEYEVSVGDVIVIPAGLGHMGVETSKDFQVVGAYPGGKEPDLIRSGQGFIPSALKRIAVVPCPEQDPIFGVGGPLFDYWSAEPTAS